MQDSGYLSREAVLDLLAVKLGILDHLSTTITNLEKLITSKTVRFEKIMSQLEKQ